MKLDLSLVTDVKVEGINTDDYPDFADAFISEAMYDGQPMTDLELEVLNEAHDFVYNQLMNKLY